MEPEDSLRDKEPPKKIVTALKKYEFTVPHIVKMVTGKSHIRRGGIAPACGRQAPNYDNPFWRDRGYNAQLCLVLAGNLMITYCILQS
jgi:hypothetical protein